MSTYDLQPHRETWLGFARLLRWVVATIVVVLLLLAYFLV
ncbi:MAG: aa3-type cytochrome c oxidase subunit IV [Alphaproteobacteria bacterium]|nr:aa3-type cytochrome c oxidase subunit IV [Alphaproteobacteria bacterium]